MVKTLVRLIISKEKMSKVNFTCELNGEAEKKWPHQLDITEPRSKKPLNPTLWRRQQGDGLKFTMQKQWTSSYKSKTITGFEPLEETINHFHSVLFTYRRTQTLNHDTKIYIIALQTKMPNDQGGCRPLMAAKLTTQPARTKYSVQKWKGVGLQHYKSTNVWRRPCPHALPKISTSVGRVLMSELHKCF